MYRNAWLVFQIEYFATLSIIHPLNLILMTFQNQSVTTITSNNFSFNKHRLTSPKPHKSLTLLGEVFLFCTHQCSPHTWPRTVPLIFTDEKPPRYQFINRAHRSRSQNHIIPDNANCTFLSWSGLDGISCAWPQAHKTHHRSWWSSRFILFCLWDFVLRCNCYSVDIYLSEHKNCLWHIASPIHPEVEVAGIGLGLMCVALRARVCRRLMLESIEKRHRQVDMTHIWRLIFIIKLISFVCFEDFCMKKKT